MSDGGKEVHSLLQLPEKWPCHILLVNKMKFASLEADLGRAWGTGTGFWNITKLRS